jgi:hypothetical protein
MIPLKLNDTLREFCQNFPSVLKPSFNANNLYLGLPQSIKAKLKSQIGQIQMASDFSRQMVPARGGISVRLYQPGDSLQSVNLRKLITNNLLESRIDFSPGRQKCVIFLHCYKNMEFSTQNISKFQLAQMLTGLFQLLLRGHFKEIQTIAIYSKNYLEEAEFKLGNKKNTINYAAHITDGFFNSHAIESSSQELLQLIKTLKTKQSIWYARDPWENSALFEKMYLNSNNTLKSMTPFLTNNTSTEKKSGRVYLENLKEQELKNKTCFQKQGVSFQNLHSLLTFNDILSMVNLELNPQIVVGKK